MRPYLAWKVGLLLGSFVLGLLGMVSVRAFSTYRQTLGSRGPIPHAEAFLRDLRQRDDRAALARTWQRYQASHSPAQLRVAVDSIPALARHTRARFEGFRIVRTSFGSDALLEGHLITPQGETTLRMVLMRDSGDDGPWYVHGLAVGGQWLP
jgi:hypothetical protein